MSNPSASSFELILERIQALLWQRNFNDAFNLAYKHNRAAAAQGNMLFWRLYGIAAAGQGFLAEALKAIDKLEALEYSNRQQALVYLALVSAYIEQGHTAHAQEALSTAHKLLGGDANIDPNEKAHYLSVRGELALHLSQPETAIEHHQDAEDLWRALNYDDFPFDRHRRYDNFVPWLRARMALYNGTHDALAFNLAWKIKMECPEGSLNRSAEARQIVRAAKARYFTKRGARLIRRAKD